MWAQAALLIPIAGIMMPVFIVWIVYYHNRRNQEQFHKTLQKLIESEQELSPELLMSIPGYNKEDEESHKRNDVRSGAITIGTGLGIALFGHFGVREEPLFGIGLLVLSIGAGIFAYGIYGTRKKGDNGSSWNQMKS
jgi:hypothetical protein|tara:strand:- start:21 stop:431 length:411 start_codon:yes stop_codon:yes gene_type:complete